MRIQIWISLMIIAIIFIGSTVSFVSISTQTKDVFINEAKEDNARLIVFINELLKTHISHLESTLQTLADDPKYVDALINNDSAEKGQIEKEMTLIEQSTVAIKNIGLFSKGGIAIATNDASKSLIGTNLSNQTYLANAITLGDEYLSEAFYSQITESPEIAVSLPVQDYTWTLQGVVLATLNMEDLLVHLDEISGDRFEIIILDKAKNILIGTITDNSKIIPASENRLTHQVSMKLNEGRISGFLSPIELGSAQYYASYEKFDGYTIIVYKPANFVAFPLESIKGIILETLGIIGLLILILIWVFSRSISNPVSKLTKDIGQITKGDLNIELGQSKFDELQGLIDALNRVLASLKLAILRTGATKRDVGLGEAIKAREEIEAKYKTLFEVVPSAISTLNAEGKVTSWNAQAEEITGYSPEEIIGKSLDEIEGMPTDFVEFKIPSSGDEYQIKSKDGTKKYISLNIDHLRDAGANNIGLILSFQDITEKKSVEQELSDSHEAYKSIFENSPEAIVIFDKKGNMIASNDRLKDWTGYDPNKYLGINLMKMPWLTRKAKAIALKNFTARMLGAKIEPYVLEFKGKKGNSVMGKIFATPLKEHGENVGDLIMISDVTLEVEREKHKKGSFAIHWESAFDTLPELIAVYDQNLTIVEANKAFADSLGLKKKDIIGKKCYEIFHKTKSPIKTCPHEKARKNGKAVTTEYYEPILNKMIKATANPIFDKTGAFAGSIYIIKMSKKEDKN